MSASQTTHPSKLSLDVGTYFVGSGDKLYYIDAIMENGVYAIENCKSELFLLWTKAQVYHRCVRVVIPSEGGE